MKKLAFSIATLTAFTALTFPAQAKMTEWDAEVSANVGFVTDYAFRGISQSNEGPALQGGFDLTHGTGLYAGVWGSNVNFNDGNEASVEVDFYAGYATSYKNVDVDFGVIYYAYPGADETLNYDFAEVALSLGHDFGPFAATGSVNYSPEYFADSGNATYLALGVDVPLPSDFSLSGHIGYQTIQDNVSFGIGDDSYTDWSLGLNYAWKGFDLSLQYVDTSLDQPAECADGCEERVIFGISRSF